MQLATRFLARPRPLLVLVSALLTLGTVSLGSSGAGTEEQQPSEGVPSSPELDEALEALQLEAQRRWPDSFAGLWIDEKVEDDGTLWTRSVSLAFTSGSEEKVEALEQDFLVPELFEPAVTARWSLHELEDRQMKLVSDRELVRRGELSLPGVPNPRFNTWIDEKTNSINVLIEEVTPVTQLTFKERYGSDIIVHEGDVGGPTCNREDCRYELRSGLATKDEFSQTPICSTAFTVVMPNGNRNILSAGHCGTSGGGDITQPRRHGGERYGVVREQQIQGPVDAERIGPPIGDFKMRPWIFVNGDNKAVRVESMSSWDGFVTGQRVCKSGRTTKKTCGDSFSKHYAPHWVPSSYRFIAAFYCALSGDSGAGVYRDANWSRVHGIHSGAAAGSGSCPDPDAWSAFGHLEHALDALGGGTLLKAG